MTRTEALSKVAQLAALIHDARLGIAADAHALDTVQMLLDQDLISDDERMCHVARLDQGRAANRDALEALMALFDDLLLLEKEVRSA